jgi:hypothetical protein
MGFNSACKGLNIHYEVRIVVFWDVTLCKRVNSDFSTMRGNIAPPSARVGRS